MDPNTFETPPVQEPQLQPQSKSRKRWIIIGSILGVLLIGAVVAAVLLYLLPKKPEAKTAQPTVDIPKEFKVASVGPAKTYAGNKVYDACSFISFDTVRQTVGSYQNLLNLAGGTTRADDPLVIEHRYIDRDIPTVLGKDGQPRSKSITVGGEGKDDISNFLSTADSNCWYGQGEDIASGGKGITFAKVFVSQLPTPLSQELKAYLGKMTKSASADGVDIYVEQGLDAAGFAGVVFINESKSLAVLLQVGNANLAEPMMKDIAKVLTDGPGGPIEVQYPAPWHTLKNPCSLLTGDDFEQFTGKKAQALAQERATLTEMDDTFMERRCFRVEVDNSGTNISTTTVNSRFARVENNAKLYVENLRNGKDPLVTIEPLSQPIEGVDDAYVIVRKLFGEVWTYELEVRSGANVISVDIDGESGLDASAAAYAERVTPAMNSVLKKWRE